MTQTRILLDVDTGVDDAQAIFYAVRHPEIELVGLTTTYGNLYTATTTLNTLKILELLGRPDIPVARGVDRSLITPFHVGAPHVHGANGIGDVDLPHPSIAPIDLHAADFIIETIKANPGTITLVPVGPLTNIALALVKAPEIAKLARGIVIMGSNLHLPGVHGLPSPHADPNFFNDPEAAHIVLQAGAKVTLVGMNATMPTILTRSMADEIAREGDQAAQVLMQITAFYTRAYQIMYPGIAGAGVHDALAVAIAHDPSLATTQPMYVDVELHGQLTRGQTVSDRRSTANNLHNAIFVTDVDRPRFLSQFAQVLKTPRTLHR